MAKRKSPRGEGERPKREGREREIHEEIVRKRLEGGKPPTADTYARALEQWHKLPGSIVRPPSDINPPTEPSEKLDTPPNDDQPSTPPAKDDGTKEPKS